MSPQTEKGLGQASVMHARRGEAKAGQKACGGNGHQDVETHVRTDAATPAFGSLAGQPASSSPFDATNRDTGGIQDLIELFGLGPVGARRAGKRSVRSTAHKHAHLAQIGCGREASERRLCA